MNSNEKRINEIKLRFTDSELAAIARCSSVQDRTIADFLHHAVNGYLFGYDSRITDASINSNQANKD